jgi:hypothetical protein
MKKRTDQGTRVQHRKLNLFTQTWLCRHGISWSRWPITNTMKYVIKYVHGFEFAEHETARTVD